MRYQFERTDLDHEKCEYPQCKYKKVPNSSRCPRHGANKELQKKANQLMYEFKTDRVKARVNLLAAEPHRYGLDQELGILRLTLEEVINKVSDDQGLFQASDSIKNIVMSIEKLVQSCLTQSRQLKLLLTLQDLYASVQAMVDIVAEEVEDEEALERIANRIDAFLSSEFDGKQAKIQDSQQSLELDPTESFD